ELLAWSVTPNRRSATRFQLCLGSQYQRILELKTGKTLADAQAGCPPPFPAIIGPETIIRAPIADLVEERDTEIIIRSDRTEKILTTLKGPMGLQRLGERPTQHLSHALATPPPLLPPHTRPAIAEDLHDVVIIVFFQPACIAPAIWVG